MGNQLDDGFHESAMNATACCPVLELRQYTLHPGKRDVLIGLFEREFIESQEALGMTLVGQFHDLDKPDRFVWLRGFPDMTARAQALQAFYGGPVWKANREAANATMIDSDNVLLLRPAGPGAGFLLDREACPPPRANPNPRGLIAATVCHLSDGASDDFADFFERAINPALVKADASPIAVLVTENHPNTFPALPVREDANVFVWFSKFSDERAFAHHTAVLSDSPDWKNIAAELTGRLKGPPENLRLRPTPRSRLHG